ncbi:Os06g0178800, partial [Oryza sativa Japonica Group]
MVRNLITQTMRSSPGRGPSSAEPTAAWQPRRHRPILTAGRDRWSGWAPVSRRRRAGHRRRGLAGTGSVAPARRRPVLALCLAASMA